MAEQLQNNPEWEKESSLTTPDDRVSENDQQPERPDEVLG